MGVGTTFLSLLLSYVWFLFVCLFVCMFLLCVGMLGVGIEGIETFDNNPMRTLISY